MWWHELQVGREDIDASVKWCAHTTLHGNAQRRWVTHRMSRRCGGMRRCAREKDSTAHNRQRMSARHHICRTPRVLHGAVVTPLAAAATFATCTRTASRHAKDAARKLEGVRGLPNHARQVDPPRGGVCGDVNANGGTDRMAHESEEDRKMKVKLRKRAVKKMEAKHLEH